MKAVLLLVATLIFALLPTMGSKAQTQTSISVAPAILEIASNQGQEIRRVLYVQNTGSDPVPISVEAQSLLSSDQQLASQTSLEHDAKKWIALDETDFILAPQERKSVPVTIIIPADAQPGGYYAQLSVRVLGLEQPTPQTSSIIIPEVTVSVLITLAGELKESIEIAPVNLVPIQITPGVEQKVSLQVTNTGNIHGLVAPELVIEKNGQEQLVKFAPRVLLPGSVVDFAELWTSPTEFGSYRAFARITYGNDTNVYQTPPERLYVTPSIPKLLLTAIAVWTLMYLYRHRFTIIPAIRVLVGNEKPANKKNKTLRH